MQLTITVVKVGMLTVHVLIINQIVITNNVNSPIWLICMLVLCHHNTWWIMRLMLPYNPYSHTSSSNRTVPLLLLKKPSQMVIQLYHKPDIHTMANHKQSNNKQIIKIHVFNDCDFLSNFLDLGANFFFLPVFNCKMKSHSKFN